MCHLPLVAQKEASHLPKIQEHFAEFLQHRCFKRLGILYQSTCVGLRYGLTLELFPGSTSLPRSSVATSTTYVLRHFKQVVEY